MRQITNQLLGVFALSLLSSTASPSLVNLEWANTFDGNLGASVDEARSIAYDGAGNIYTGGVTSTTAGGQDFCVIKTTATGLPGYTKKLHLTQFDTFRDMKVDAEGNVYVTGTIDVMGVLRAFTFKLDTTGNLMWGKQYIGQFGSAHGLSLTLDSNLDVYVTGMEPASNGISDVLLIKYSGLSGNALWSRRIDSGSNLEDYGAKVLLNGEEEVVVVGGADSVANDDDVLLMKYDGSGNQIWLRRWDSPYHKRDFASTFAIGNMNKICFATGSGTNGTNDIFTVQYSDDGTMQWQKQFDGFVGSDAGFICLTDVTGAVYVSGVVTAQGTNNSDGIVLKYTDQGAFVWKNIYKGPADGMDFCFWTGFDVEKQLIVVTQELGVGTLTDIGVFKISPNGTPSWVYHYDGPAHDDDKSAGIAMGTLGDFAICGYQDTSSGSDMHTLRFSQDPVAKADSYTATEHTLLTVPTGSGVFTNDMYYGTGIGTAVLVADAQHGTLQLDSFGGFTYLPDQNFSGTDTFTYKINRNGVFSPTTTVTITVKAIVPTALSLNPTTVFGGFSSLATVTMSNPAPTGGLVVNVTSSSTALIVPPMVTVPAGATQATFNVGTTNVSAQATRMVSVTRGGVTKNASLTINPYPALTSLTVTPSTVVGGLNTTGKVTLSLAAPAGGVTVALSDNSTALTTPANVLVPAGATTANFTIGTGFVATTSVRTVTASLMGVNKTASVTLNPVALVSVGVNPTTVKGGNPTTGTVTLNGPAPTGGITVTLTPNSTVLVTPATVKVLAGQTSVSFTVTTKPVTVQSVRSITATYDGVSKSCNVTLIP